MLTKNLICFYREMTMVMKFLNRHRATNIKPKLVSTQHPTSTNIPPKIQL